MEYDYEAICQQMQQHNERDLGHAAELVAGVKDRELLLAALRASRKECATVRKENERLQQENDLLREERELEHRRPQFSECKFENYVAGDQNNTYKVLDYAKSDVAV